MAADIDMGSGWVARLAAACGACSRVQYNPLISSHVLILLSLPLNTTFTPGPLLGRLKQMRHVVF